jgi:signal-transduction protein with cAMP-binding, CBS, and nucleotidyltransferase domain
MRQKKVIEIAVPYQEGTPDHPAVTMNDKIIDAVELMVNNGLHQIAVVCNNRPVGMIRLEDAFRELGLQGTVLKDRVVKPKSL